MQTPEAQVQAAERRNEVFSDRRELTRKRLLRAALELVGHDHGLNVRIEEVCARARISRGTFYNYFSSMEELFEALWFELNHQFDADMQAALADVASEAERTSAVIQCYLERARGDPRWGWAMVNIAATGFLFGGLMFTEALKTVERGVAAGEFDLPDARLGRDMIVGACLTGMVTQLREGAPDTHPAAVARLVLRAFGVADTGPR